MRTSLELLQIIVLTYIDDSTIISTRIDAEASAEAFDILSDCLGLVLSTKTESNQSSVDGDDVAALGMEFVTSWKF